MKFVVLLNFLLIFHHSCESANVFLEKLDSLLIFCMKNEQKLTPGVLLGISIAKGQLENIPNGEGDKFIVSLIQKCSYLEEKIEVYKKFPTKFNEIVSKTIINSTLFANNLSDIEYGRLTKSTKKIRLLKTYLYLVNSKINSPNGEESDRCLAELFVDCKISEKCLNAENHKLRSFGYQLTHKLLFHQMRSIYCKNDSTLLQQSTVICSEIFLETQFIIRFFNIIPELKDLFMEQIFLCSNMGFGEFLRSSWIKKIISWQLKSGCFSYDGKYCSHHMNGLGSANLALFARVLYL